jgi:hypothetical protein
VHVIKTFEISEVSSLKKKKRNNKMFSVLVFDKALKLHIVLKSTMENK